MTDPTSPPEPLSDNCCWNGTRDICIGAKCDCACHTIPDPMADLRAQVAELQRVNNGWTETYHHWQDARDKLEATVKAATERAARAEQLLRTIVVRMPSPPEQDEGGAFGLRWLTVSSPIWDAIEDARDFLEPS